MKLTPFAGSDVNLLLAAYNCVKEDKLATLAGSLVSSLSVNDKKVKAELFLNKSYICLKKLIKYPMYQMIQNRRNIQIILL